MTTKLTCDRTGCRKPATHYLKTWYCVLMLCEKHSKESDNAVRMGDDED